MQRKKERADQETMVPLDWKIRKVPLYNHRRTHGQTDADRMKNESDPTRISFARPLL